VTRQIDVSFRLEVDEPGRLVLGRHPPPKRPLLKVAAPTLVAVVAIPALCAGVGQRELSVDGLLYLAVVVILALIPTVAVLAWVFREARTFTRLAIDRVAGRIDIEEVPTYVDGPGVVETILLPELEAMRVSAWPRRRPSGGLRFEITVRLEFPATTGRQSQEVSFEVAGVDSSEDAAQLAHRLASAAGVANPRVLRDDGAIDIWFGGLQPAGSLEAVPADAPSSHGYEEAAFDPARFKSKYRLLRWEPGREVHAYLPWGWGALGCAPVLLLGLLAGPLVFLRFSMYVVERERITALAALCGLAAAGAAARVMWRSRARTIVFDWAKQRLRVETFASTRTYDFSALRGLELKRVEVSWGNDSYRYSYSLQAQVTKPGGRTESIKLLDTALDREPYPPYRMVLPLANELARSIGVSVTVKG
jgi:hypothetical protein